MTADTINAKIYKIIDVTVIDVEKEMAVPGQTVTIVGDRIDKVGVPERVGAKPKPKSSMVTGSI